MTYSPMSMLGMASSSVDLRQEILHAWERQLGSQRALADLFGVSFSCIETLLQRYRTTGDIRSRRSTASA